MRISAAPNTGLVTAAVPGLPIGICEMQIRQIAYMHSSPGKPTIQASGYFKSECFKERTMKNTMMLIMVLGLVTLANSWAGTSSDNLASFADNSVTMTCPDVVIGIQSDDGSVCVVYLEITDVGRPAPVSASALANITTQLPDIATIMLLGLGGLLYRGRKE